MKNIFFIGLLMVAIPAAAAQKHKVPFEGKRPAPVEPPPSQDDGSAPSTQFPVMEPPREHTTIMRNSVIVHDIETERRIETVPNRYYWHHSQNTRYSHIVRNGIHWYGFYYGPSYYWTRYRGGSWWWYDSRFNRWAYWWDDYWWSPGPRGAVDVYVHDNYYPYDAHVVSATPPVYQEPPEDNVPSPTQPRNWESPDKRRLVQVEGENAEGFLYEKTGAGDAVFLKYLGRDVADVRFSGGESGQPLRIRLDFTDDTFATFDENGVRLDDEKNNP